MQRSLRGCLATLLYQLACAQRGSLEALLRQNQEKLADLLKNGFSQGNLSDHDWVFMTQLVEGDRSVDNWSRKELSFAFQYVSNCTNARCCIFLDALDECDQSHDINDLFDAIRELQHVCDLKFCVSSRDEPHFRSLFHNVPKLRLQDLTRNDMRRVICTSLHQPTHMPWSNITEAEIVSLTDGLKNKAEGVFLGQC